MTRQDQGGELHMDKAHEYELLQDLLDISKEKGFGDRFDVKLAEKNRSDRLVIKVPFEDERVVKIIVTFREYPTIGLPQIETRGDEISDLVAQTTIHLLMNYKSKLKKIQDIVTIVQQATGIVSNESSASEQSSNHPVKNAVRQGLAFLKADDKKVVKSKRDAASASLNSIQPSVDDYVLTVAMEKLFVLEVIVDKILKDFSKYAPNEYAFICSGVFTQEGTAFITDYYPGQMQVSTPVYCELKESFIEDTVYNKIPKGHNLIVWGHVHPIEGPSGTDVGSFHDLAEWDREATKQGILAKRSLALLINAHNNRMSFYDIHSPSKQRISHSVIAAGGGKSYGY